MAARLFATIATLIGSSSGLAAPRVLSRRRTRKLKIAEAVAASEVQDWPRAVLCWREVINNSHGKVPSDAYFQLSKACRKAGDLEAAQKYVRQGRSEHPDDSRLAVLDARIAVERKEWTVARKLWQSVLGNHYLPNAPEPYIQLCSIERNLGRLDAAEEIVRQGLTKYPGDARLAERYAAIADERQDWHEAIVRWKKALALAGDRGLVSNYVAAFHSYCKAGIPAEGRALVSEALMHRPNNTKLLVEYAISENFIRSSGYGIRPLEAIAGTPPVEIVICVHNALGELKNCLDSIFRHTPNPYFLTIVDDDSEDSLKAFVGELASRRPSMRILDNPRNIGYTKSANRGVREARADWVVLLNSDTIVTRGWLEGLFECAFSDEKIRAVGPLSNAATMQSIPDMRDDRGEFAVNKLPEGISPDDMGEIVHHASKRSFPRVAVLNGFCLLLHKPTITEVGLFDEIHFPRGYGEENDLCLRLIKARYKLAIADQVYVYHTKTQSFSQAERQDLIRSAHKNLRELWADYSYPFIADSVANLDSMIELRAKIRSHALPTEAKGH